MVGRGCNAGFWTDEVRSCCFGRSPLREFRLGPQWRGGCSCWLPWLVAGTQQHRCCGGGGVTNSTTRHYLFLPPEGRMKDGAYRRGDDRMFGNRTIGQKDSVGY